MDDLLSPDELRLLLAGLPEEEGDGPLPGGEVIPLQRYDFETPIAVAPPDFKGFQGLFDAFAREINYVLPPMLRTAARVELSSLDQLTFDEFVLSVPRPTALSILELAPLPSLAVLELNPGLVLAIVERLLGGKGGEAPAPRELTEIEMTIVERVVGTMLEALRAGWGNFAALAPRLVQQESDPYVLQVLPGSEPMLLAAYEVQIGDLREVLNFCLPMRMLSALLAQRAPFAEVTGAASGETPSMAAMARHLEAVPLKLEALLGEAHFSAAELTALRPGMLLPLQGQELTLLIEGVPRFKARAACQGERCVAQVLGPWQ